MRLDIPISVPFPEDGGEGIRAAQDGAILGAKLARMRFDYPDQMLARVAVVNGDGTFDCDRPGSNIYMRHVPTDSPELAARIGRYMTVVIRFYSRDRRKGRIVQIAGGIGESASTCWWPHIYGSHALTGRQETHQGNPWEIATDGESRIIYTPEDISADLTLGVPLGLLIFQPIDDTPGIDIVVAWLGFDAIEEEDFWVVERVHLSGALAAPTSGLTVAATATTRWRTVLPERTTTASSTAELIYDAPTGLVIFRPRISAEPATEQGYLWLLQADSGQVMSRGATLQEGPQRLAFAGSSVGLMADLLAIWESFTADGRVWVRNPATRRYAQAATVQVDALFPDGGGNWLQGGTPSYHAESDIIMKAARGQTPLDSPEMELVNQAFSLHADLRWPTSKAPVWPYPPYHAGLIMGNSGAACEPFNGGHPEEYHAVNTTQAYFRGGVVKVVGISRAGLQWSWAIEYTQELVDEARIGLYAATGLGHNPDYSEWIASAGVDGFWAYSPYQSVTGGSNVAAGFASSSTITGAGRCISLGALTFPDGKPKTGDARVILLQGWLPDVGVELTQWTGVAPVTDDPDRSDDTAGCDPYCQWWLERLDTDVPVSPLPSVTTYTTPRPASKARPIFCPHLQSVRAISETAPLTTDSWINRQTNHAYGLGAWRPQIEISAEYGFYGQGHTGADIWGLELEAACRCLAYNAGGAVGKFPRDADGNTYYAVVKPRVYRISQYAMRGLTTDPIVGISRFDHTEPEILGGGPGGSDIPARNVFEFYEIPKLQFCGSLYLESLDTDGALRWSVDISQYFDFYLLDPTRPEADDYDDHWLTTQEKRAPVTDVYQIIPMGDVVAIIVDRRFTLYEEPYPVVELYNAGSGAFIRALEFHKDEFTSVRLTSTTGYYDWPDGWYRNLDAGGNPTGTRYQVLFDNSWLFNNYASPTPTTDWFPGKGGVDTDGNYWHTFYHRWRDRLLGTYGHRIVTIRPHLGASGISWEEFTGVGSPANSLGLTNPTNWAVPGGGQGVYCDNGSAIVRVSADS